MKKTSEKRPRPIFHAHAIFFVFSLFSTEPNPYQPYFDI